LAERDRLQRDIVSLRRNAVSGLKP
jgi:hypothetical protein